MSRALPRGRVERFSPSREKKRGSNDAGLSRFRPDSVRPRHDKVLAASGHRKAHDASRVRRFAKLSGEPNQ